MPGGAVVQQTRTITAEEARDILLKVPGGYFQNQAWLFEEHVGGKGGLWVVVMVGIFAALGGGLFGLDIGYISGVETMQSFLDSMNGGKPLPETKMGLITGIFALGAVVAAFPSVVDTLTLRLGRKGCVILGGFFFCAGALMQGLAPNIGTMYTGRFVAGASVGILSATIPIYQGEIAPPAFRGMIVALYQMAITLGILVAFWLNYALSHKDQGWRYCILFQLVPGICLSLGGFFLPRSPRWLATRGRHKDAYRTLVNVRSSRDDVRGELALVYQEYMREAGYKPRWGEFCSGVNGKLLIIGVSLQMVQQLCGMNMFMYYGPKIFHDIFQDPNASFKFQFWSGIVNSLSTIPALFLVDRAGRMMLMRLSAIGMGVSCLLLAIVGNTCFTTPPESCSEASVSGAPLPLECQVSQYCGDWSKYTLAGSVFFFIVNFAYGWGPVVWVYCAEIFPLKYRTKANGLTTDANWVGNFLIGYLPPFMLNHMRFSTFYIFAAINGLALVLSCVLPETKGKSLEEIQLDFELRFGGHKEISNESVSVSCESSAEDQ